MTQCCKTCRFLDVPLDKAGRRVVRDKSYRCTAPIPEIVTPDSVERQGFYKVRMCGDMGTTCPVWEALK